MQQIKQINLSRELTHQSLARNQSHAFPVEILARIFTFYRSEALQAPDNPFLRILYPSWIDITHVCHHWRAVALNHGQLWSSVTRGLSLPWIKTFMERSGTMLMDFDIYVTPQCRDSGACLHHEDIVPLLANFTRVRSLCLTGSCNDIFPIVDSLRKSLPVQTLSLFLEDNMSDLILPDNLFGGEAPIRRLQLVGGHILVPCWLLHGVTHFTFTPTNLTFPEVFNTLRYMSMLTYFEFRPRTWCYSGESFTTGASPIQMPQLVNLIVGAYCAHDFILLNQALLLHVDAKRRLELRPSCYNFSASIWHAIDGLSPFVEAVNGFQHIQFSGAQNHSRFLLWSGDVGTTWEDATLCLSVEWSDRERQRIQLNPFIGFCTQIGAARVRRLVVESSSSGLPKSYWWKILRCFPGIEELELYPAGADILGDAWRINLAPAVLPALRRVQIVHSEHDHPSSLYTIIRVPPARRIVALSSSTEDGASAEQEIENISKGLLRLVRGLGRNPKKGKRKGRGTRG